MLALEMLAHHHPQFPATVCQEIVREASLLRLCLKRELATKTIDRPSQVRGLCGVSSSSLGVTPVAPSILPYPLLNPRSFPSLS